MAKSKAKGRKGGGGRTDDLRDLLSRNGLRNPFTRTTPAEVAAIRPPPVVSSDASDPRRAPPGAQCWICLEGPADGNDEPLRRDCACRGSDGYVHLGCFSSYAARRSEEIWCGEREAGPNMDWLAFARPWESCPNCHQYFSGRLRLDIAREHARLTEGMVGGDRAFRHVTARSWVTKSLSDRQGGESCALRANYEIARCEYDEVLHLIEESLPIYESTRREPLMEYIHATLRQSEGEVQCNYALMTALRLKALIETQHSVTEEQMALYFKWDKLMNSAMEIFDGLQTGIFNSGPFKGSMAQTQMMTLAIKTQYSHQSKEFSHLAASAETKQKALPKDEREILRLSEELMRTHIRERGEGSTDGIRFALVHAQKLITAREDWRPFEALALLEKTLKTSLLSLGPNHDLTGKARCTLGLLAASNRKAAYRYDPQRTPCPVLRYEEDCDIYIVDVAGLPHKIPGVNDGDEMGWDPADAILKAGAFVECVDLVRASHLNGMRAWVEDYDEKTERHLVRFEDEGTKPCLVRPGNLRLLFFGGEYKPTESDEDMESLANDDGDSGVGVSSVMGGYGQDSDEVDDDIPDLG